jgi:hypothetical protein
MAAPYWWRYECRYSGRRCHPPVHSSIMKSHRTVIATILLSIDVLIIYFNVQYFEFLNYDDSVYISENQIIKSGLTWKGVAGAFTTNYYGNWHPITTISFMVEYEIFRLEAGAYHWNNLLFHILNSLLLFLVFKRITRAFWQSLAVAALFALHPLHVESVAWISGRKDVLCALFWFLTMYAYARYAEQQTLLRYVFVLLSFTLGLMAKPMLVTLPFVLLLLDYWPLSRFTFRQIHESISKLILEKIPLIVLSIASSVITFLAQKDSQAVISLESLSLQTRLSNAFVTYVKYIYKTLWPVDLAVLYPYPDAVPLDQLVFSIAMLIIITVIVLYFIKDYPYLFIGWFWYLGTLIPVIGIVQVGVQAMADRYTYIPLIGLNCPSRDHHSFNDRMRIAFHNTAIHKSPGISFIGIANHIFLVSFGGTGELPFQTGGKSSSATAAFRCAPPRAGHRLTAGASSGWRSAPASPVSSRPPTEPSGATTPRAVRRAGSGWNPASGVATRAASRPIPRTPSGSP